MNKSKLERWESVGKSDRAGKYEVRVSRDQSTKGRERYRVKCVRGKLRAAHLIAIPKSFCFRIRLRQQLQPYLMICDDRTQAQN